ncbi:fe-containing alcohol [Lecanosticta acicola]|uniref:Fe-containing alcohol n=1 Tax=Lecanosticta acicola TaxID=111012 RepID=A0AAI8YT89_9PEZI|nr:fe-containing alcohol [Lecanosticta acicola]
MSAETTALHTLSAQSHGARHQSRHKKHDPFLDLSDDALKRPDQPSPNTSDQNGQTTSEHSIIADLILTPISVISFILSLCIVEREQRQWRLSQHAPSPNPSSWSQFGRRSPEPYQHSEGSTWHPHLSWHRRGVAKSQLDSVFEMRSRVLVALAAWTLLGFLAVFYASRRMYNWAFA